MKAPTTRTSRRLEDWLQNSTARVLTCMAREPRASWSVTDIARRAGVGLGTASIKLRELQRLGIVLRPDGRGGRYILNRHHPLVRQWKILLNVWDLQPAVRRIRRVARRIVLFGSAAEGRDDEESDLDLYIEADSPGQVEGLLPDHVKGRAIQALICDSARTAQLMSDSPVLWASISRGVVLWDELEAW